MIRVLFLILISVSLKAQSVYKTPSGAKYHLADCRMVQNVSEEITAAKAIELGLLPCKICKPADVYLNRLPVMSKAKGEGNTVQCKGMTKSGKRCKHMNYENIHTYTL
jgi:hypothetical protein